MEYKGRIQLLSTKPQMIYRRILWCWGQKVFCPQLMPTNCSVAKQLPQFYKHSKSADLLRKLLLSTLRFGWCKTNIHWMFCTSCLAGPKFKSLIMQAWTAFWPFDPGIIFLLLFLFSMKNCCKLCIVFFLTFICHLCNIKLECNVPVPRKTASLHRYSET